MDKSSKLHGIKLLEYIINGNLLEYTKLSDIGKKLTFYLENIEEASFLYEQRLTLLTDPELNWQNLDEFEERFEAHIDALVKGEEFALAVCKHCIIEGDSGELHAAIRVFCRQNRFDLFLAILESLEFDDEEKVRAVTDALNLELPNTWISNFLKLISESNPNLIPIVTEPVGYKRLPASRELLSALKGIKADNPSSIIWSLGRLREEPSAISLFNYIHCKDTSICTQAALSLLRIGKIKAKSICMKYIKEHEWPFIPLGLCSNASDVQAILKIAYLRKINSDYLITLGLLGDIAVINILFHYFENPKFSKFAAMAFNLITGANLCEEVFIPEEIDEDELFEEEIEKLNKGESLTPPDKSPPGTTINRISQNPDEWQKWWSENKSRFISDIRYRNGKPYSPACLLENLKSEKSSRKIRQLAYEELVIRYNIDFPFETDMFVIQQKQVLSKYSEWIEANNTRFQEGKWYFAGQLT